MNFLLVFLLYLPWVFSFSLGSLVSSALDLVPVVGNLKSLIEAIIEKDMITGEELSEAEIALIHGGNYLKIAKHFMNRPKIFVGVPILKQKMGKVKIANSNFAKVGERAIVKVSNIVKFVFKTAKTFFKLGKEDNKDNEDM